MTHIDLFSGIGGFALAARWTGFETVQFVEIDPFCQKVLQKNFPGVPIHGDIKTFKWTSKRPSILTAGFPCQPFSTANHGAKSAVADFSECLLGSVESIMPTYTIIENVQRAVIERIAERLRYVGFDAFVRRYAAASFGAWHRRNRWFVIAHPNDKSEFQSVVDAKMAVVQGVENSIWWSSNYPGMLRADDGVSYRVDRLKSLGNSIVPQVAYEIMKAILETGRGK